MNKLFIVVIATWLISMGWTRSTLAQAEPVMAAPVDFQACTFNKGKTMKDLDKVSANFRKYAKQNDIAYSAWTLTPQYHNSLGFDVGWLGAWPDGNAFGVSMETWAATGGDIAAQFREVMDCSSRHEMAISLPINAPEGTPEDGILMFYQCTLHDNISLDEAYAAHLKAGQVMKGLGSLAVSWMFQPAAGAGDIDFDYYHVLGFYRYSDLGATMEMYVNGGGQKKQQKFLGKVSSCETPVIFDAISVRAPDER